MYPLTEQSAFSEVWTDLLCALANSKLTRYLLLVNPFILDLSSAFQLAGLRPDSPNTIQIALNKELPPTLRGGLWVDKNNTLYK